MKYVYNTFPLSKKMSSSTLLKFKHRPFSQNASRYISSCFGRQPPVSNRASIRYPAPKINVIAPYIKTIIFCVCVEYHNAVSGHCVFCTGTPTQSVISYVCLTNCITFSSHRVRCTDIHTMTAIFYVCFMQTKANTSHSAL